MRLATHKIHSTSGNEIEITIRTPAETVKGVIQINTGTCIPQRVYWKFAEYLTHHGYITLTYDYTDASNFSSEISHTSWLKDLESVFDYVISTFPDFKKYIVGHSSGGQFIGYMSNANHAEKIVLIASSNGYYKNLKWYMQWVMLLFWKVIVPFSVWRYGYMNNRLLGTNGGFPKNIILELRSWCFNPDFFVPYFASKNIPSYYSSITRPIIAYHLADDAITTQHSCQQIVDLYSNSKSSLETLNAKDFGMKKFGHRGFFFAAAKRQLWPKFIHDLEN